MPLDASEPSLCTYTFSTTDGSAVGAATSDTTSEPEPGPKPKPKPNPRPAPAPNARNVGRCLIVSTPTPNQVGVTISMPDEAAPLLTLRQGSGEGTLIVAAPGLLRFTLDNSQAMFVPVTAACKVSLEPLVQLKRLEEYTLRASLRAELANNERQVEANPCPYPHPCPHPYPHPYPHPCPHPYPHPYPNPNPIP